MKFINFRICICLSGYLLVQQNIIAADVVPPPPPLPSANESVVPQQPAPAPIPVPEGGRSGKSAPISPSGKNKDHLETEITIVPKKSETRAEYRAGGMLYMIKITPKHGRPYYLIDHRGDGVFVRSDLAPKIAIPMWVIKRF